MSTPQSLWLYSDFVTACWSATPDDWRRKTGKAGNCAHSDVAAPDGYHKPHGHLASDPVERVLTMHDFVRALTP